MKSFLLLCLLLLLPFDAAAEPMHIYFNEMMAQSPNIAIIEFLGWEGNAKTAYDVFQYQVKVLEVLRGTWKAGATQTVGRAHGGVQVEKGTRCIAFINNDGGFEWVGVPLRKEQTLENGLIFLEGFYDFNAYLVSPCIITLPQLKQYIEKGGYESKIKGKLHFFSNKTKQMEPSEIAIEIDYSYKDGNIKQETKVLGYAWKTFPQKAQVRLPAWDGEVELRFEENMVRPLYINGDVLRVDKDGTLNALFWSQYPEEMTYEEFLEYDSSEKNGPPVFEFDIETPDKTYTFIANEEGGRIGYMVYNGQRLDCNSFSDDHTREIIFPYNGGNLVILMEPHQVSKERLRYTRERFVRELKINPVKGKLLMRGTDGKESVITSCTLHYKLTRFGKNINYRGK